MKDADDPIPVGMISISEAFDRVYRALISDWETIEERLNPSAPFYERLSEQDAERARREAWHSFDLAQRRANQWLRTRLSDGTLTALVRDPQTGDVLQLDRSKWFPLGDFETGITDDHVGPGDVLGSGPDTLLAGARRPVFFSRENFEAVLKELARDEGVSLEGRMPTTYHAGARPSSNARRTQKQHILDIYQRLWPNGCDERPAERNKKIVDEFRRLQRPLPTDRSIQRALKSD